MREGKNGAYCRVGPGGKGITTWKANLLTKKKPIPRGHAKELSGEEKAAKRKRDANRAGGKSWGVTLSHCSAPFRRSSIVPEGPSDDQPHTGKDQPSVREEEGELQADRDRNIEPNPARFPSSPILSSEAREIEFAFHHYILFEGIRDQGKSGGKEERGKKDAAAVPGGKRGDKKWNYP